MLITRRLFASINAHRLPRAATIAFSLLLLSTSPDASIATTSELQEQVKRIEQALRGLGLDPILSRTHWGAYNLVDEKTELWSALQKPGSVYRATVVSVSQSEEIGRKIFDAAVRREMENKSIFREKGSVDVGLREKGVIVLQGPLLDEGYSAGRCRALLLSGNVVVLVDQVNVSQTLVEKNDMEKARNMALEEARKGRGYVEEASKRYVEALKSHKGFFPDDHWDVKIGFEGQSEFGQGDDFSFHGKVQRLGKPVPGAQVEFKLVAPMTLQPEAGSRSYGMFLKSGKIETDAQGSWSVSGFFTPDASLSLLWETEVTASVDGQVRFASKFFTVKPLELSEDYVKRRIRDISENWKKDPSIPNGMDDSRVAAIVNSKQFCDGECHPELPPGMKVNLCSVAGQSEVTEFDCSSVTRKTLKLLNGLRFNTDKSKRLLLAGIDYGPVLDHLGFRHTAVALYPHGRSWEEGVVLEPWFNQVKEVWEGPKWRECFVFGRPGRDTGPEWSGKYPTSGSPNGHYYPDQEDLPDALIAATDPSASDLPTADEMPIRLRDGPNLFTEDRAERMPESGKRTTVITSSPAELALADAQGQHTGYSSAHRPLGGVPDADHVRVTLKEGLFINCLSIPNGQYQMRLRGKENGKFYLLAAAGKEIMPLRYCVWVNAI